MVEVIFAIVIALAVVVRVRAVRVVEEGVEELAP